MSSPANVTIRNHTIHAIETVVVRDYWVEKDGGPINGKLIPPGEEKVYKVTAKTAHHGELDINFISTHDNSKIGSLSIKSIKDPHKTGAVFTTVRESLDNYIFKVKGFRNSPGDKDLRRIVVDIDEPTDEIKIMTYNTHLFAHSTAEIPFWENLTYDDDYRRNKIVERIGEISPDIVALEEVWATSNLDSISNDLKHIYPYNYKTPTFPLDPKIGNGLLLLSKFPITSKDKIKFTNVTGEDGWSRKGALKSSLKLFGDQQIEVVITHLSSNKQDYVSNVDQIMKMFFGNNERLMPALLMGDFNMGWEDNYKKLKNIVKEKGLVDIFEGINGEFTEKDIPKYYTTNNQDNGLDKIFRPTAADGPDRLDYVFYANSRHSKFNLRPQELAVDHESWKYNHTDRIECVPVGTTTRCRSLPDIINMDLSDHYPTFVTIKVDRAKA